MQIGLHFHKLAETIVSEDSVHAYIRSTVSPGQQETDNREAFQLLKLSCYSCTCAFMSTTSNYQEARKPCSLNPKHINIKKPHSIYSNYTLRCP